MRHDPKITDRRIHRRAPAVFLGLSLAAFAACSTAMADNAPASASAPATCRIDLEAAGSSTRITGSVRASAPVSGHYVMRIGSSRSGGSTAIRQEGDFTARAGETVELGEATLPGGPAAQDVALSVTVAGRALSCTDATL